MINYTNAEIHLPYQVIPDSVSDHLFVILVLTLEIKMDVYCSSLFTHDQKSMNEFKSLQIKRQIILKIKIAKNR